MSNTKKTRCGQVSREQQQGVQFGKDNAQRRSHFEAGTQHEVGELIMNFPTCVQEHGRWKRVDDIEQRDNDRGQISMLKKWLLQQLHGSLIVTGNKILLQKLITETKEKVTRQYSVVRILGSVQRADGRYVVGGSVSLQVHE